MFFPLFYLMCPFFPCFPTSFPNATTNKFHFGIAQGDPAVLIPHKSQTFKFRDVFPPFPLLQVPGMPNDRFPKVIPGLGIGKNPFFQEEIWFIPHHFGPKNCSAPEENVGYFLHPTSPNKPIPRNTYLLISSLIILRFFFNNNFFPTFSHSWLSLQLFLSIPEMFNHHNHRWGHREILAGWAKLIFCSFPPQSQKHWEFSSQRLPRRNPKGIGVWMSLPRSQNPKKFHLFRI